MRMIYIHHMDRQTLTAPLYTISKSCKILIANSTHETPISPYIHIYNCVYDVKAQSQHRGGELRKKKKIKVQMFALATAKSHYYENPWIFFFVTVISRCQSLQRFERNRGEKKEKTKSIYSIYIHGWSHSLINSMLLALLSRYKCVYDKSVAEPIRRGPLIANFNGRWVICSVNIPILDSPIGYIHHVTLCMLIFAMRCI